MCALHYRNIVNRARLGFLESQDVLLRLFFLACASGTRTKSLFTLSVTRKKWSTTKWKAGKTDLSYGYETVVRRVCAKVTGVRRDYVQSVSSVFPSTLGIVNRLTKVRVINIDRLKQLVYRIYRVVYKEMEERMKRHARFRDW